MYGEGSEGGIVREPGWEPRIVTVGWMGGGRWVQVFFFSSRRRHTRCLSDWSSDVCSSDLDDPPDFNVSVFKGKAVSIHWESMFTRSSFQTSDMIGQHALLNDVADLIDKGVLRTTLDQTFGTINATNLKRAHALLESGKSRGKIVLEGW